MTRDKTQSQSEHSPAQGPERGLTTEALAEVLAQLREITRETGGQDAPEDTYRPLQPRSLKQVRGPIRLHTPAKRTRWPLHVAVGGCALLLAGSLALPVSGLVSDTDSQAIVAKLQALAGGALPESPVAPPAEAAPRTTRQAASEPVPTPAVAAPPILQQAVAVQPDLPAADQGTPTSTASIGALPVRSEPDVVLPPVDAPGPLALADATPAAPAPAARVEPPVAVGPVADAPAPAPAIVAASGMRIAALGEVTIRPAPTPVPATPTRPTAQASGLLARAQELIRNRDISGARLLLEKAMSTGSAEAAFQLAETYDPQVLAQWQVRGINGDPARAKLLYTKASESGVKVAQDRLRTLP